MEKQPKKLRVIIKILGCMGKSKNGSSWGTFMKHFLQVCFCISINSELGPLKKMMPPLFKNIV